MVDNKTEKVLEVKNLKKYFPITSPFGKTINYVRAVEDISFNLYSGKTLGLVGESGCGKSTTGRTILKLENPTSGEVIYNNKDIFKLNSSDFKKVRREIQMVFQDPHSSLNPKQRIGEAIEEPMKIHKLFNKNDRLKKAMNLLQETGIRADQYFRFPHEFSGGQRQRIGVARALAVDPKVIILDEPVSALDVSIQSQVLNLLADLQKKLNLSYLFISHDLSVVRHVADDIGVMYLGNMMEMSPTDELFEKPLHPYTQILLSAVPIPNPKLKRERILVKGDVPSPIDPPSGCVFHTRCPFAMDICKVEKPILKQYKNSSRKVACHLY